MSNDEEVARPLIEQLREWMRGMRRDMVKLDGKMTDTQRQIMEGNNRHAEEIGKVYVAMGKGFAEMRLALDALARRVEDLELVK